ncbi:hypothetical protein HU200_029813 [Digitaria exilis]|uniref:Uncharacterized protein n=1 Tax=Digitaria exilis TaxID=1010633 RepID=A0A835BTQ7_9POAL|nr:hypothetical protein HU200_029813 [Digitaria exilis]CAB3497843.1 unnamed protein product [Digitaria exilis]
MRPSALAAVVLVIVVLASGGVVVGTAARPVANQLTGGLSVAALDRVAVAVELTGTNSSAQPSNCTYGNNVGGVCPPTTPPASGH